MTVDVSRCSSCGVTASELCKGPRVGGVLLVHANTVNGKKFVWVTCTSCELKEQD